MGSVEFFLLLQLPLLDRTSDLYGHLEKFVGGGHGNHLGLREALSAGSFFDNLFDLSVVKDFLAGEGPDSLFGEALEDVVLDLGASGLVLERSKCNLEDCDVSFRHRGDVRHVHVFRAALGRGFGGHFK